MKKILNYSLLVIVIIVLAACSSDNNALKNNTSKSKGTKKIDIYTTVYPLSYFTERIGGEYVNVSSIYPPGANEHSFEPTQKDMMSLADADLFFYIGLGLEGFVENAEKTLANENVKLVATSNNITDQELKLSTGHTHAEAFEEADNHQAEEHDHTEIEGDHDEHNHGNVDPHVWLSPTISQDLALTIKNELVAEMPEQEAVFNENYKKLVAELNTLNDQFEKMANEATSKTFFVSHAAFGYIAGQYGLTQVPIAGLNSQSEPSQKQLTEIVELAKESNIQYILFEQNVSSNLATVIQKEVGAESLVLHNLSVLTDEDIKNGETYFSLMEKNIETLKKALK